MVATLPADLAEHYPWTGRYLRIDEGIRLHYLDEGEGSPLLMVHGNPTWSFYYRHLVEAFSGSFRCVVPDHVGCGLSDKPQDYPYQLVDHIENLVRLIDTLDLRDITLVVHDWGGPIGLGAALERSDRIARLVIFNTGVFDGPIPWEIRMCRLPVVGPLLIRGFNGFLRTGLLRATADRTRFRDGVAEGYLAPYRSWKDRIAHLRFVQDIPFEAHHPTRDLFFDIEARLPTLAHLPILLMWGRQDFCFNDHYLEEWTRRFPLAERHVFEDASHWIVEDAHERIVPRMQGFFARHPLGAPRT